MKIKVTSDYRYLVSVGSDGSLYKSKIAIVKLMKKIKLQDLFSERKLAPEKIVCDIIADRGICSYTHSQWHAKIESGKQLDDEATSSNFIYPEEREKQRQHMVRSIEERKSFLKKANDDIFSPLNKNDYEIKANCRLIRTEIEQLDSLHHQNVKIQIRSFEEQLSSILKDRD